MMIDIRWDILLQSWIRNEILIGSINDCISISTLIIILSTIKSNRRIIFRLMVVSAYDSAFFESF